MADEAQPAIDQDDAEYDATIAVMRQLLDGIDMSASVASQLGAFAGNIAVVLRRFDDRLIRLEVGEDG